jgi:Na+-driven multidrug efflux pump
LDAAVDYVKIRSISMPTSLLSNVVQASCLGAKDSVTPLIAIVWSTLVNVLGDYLLVKRFGMGLRGAAIATLLAQLASTAALLGPARRRLLRDHNLGIFKKPAPSKLADDDVSGKTFLGFAAPVLTLILGKLAAFGFMTHSAAAVPGQPTPLASHQIILSLFFFVSPFMEVISQTAQTYIPPYLAPVNEYIAKRQESNPNYDASTDSVAIPWQKAAFTVGTDLLKLGFFVATIVASLASLIPAFFGGMLTSDKVVQNAVKPLGKYLWAGAFLTAPVAVAEGILLARRELKFLAGVYLVSTALLPSALLRLKDMGGNVEQVWACFAVFQLFRAGCFTSRIWAGPVLRGIGELFGGKKAKQAGATN